MFGGFRVGEVAGRDPSGVHPPQPNCGHTGVSGARADRAYWSAGGSTRRSYALGATLYELATGEPPFGAGDPLRLTHDHLARVPTPPGPGYRRGHAGPAHRVNVRHPRRAGPNPRTQRRPGAPAVDYVQQQRDELSENRSRMGTRPRRICRELDDAVADAWLAVESIPNQPRPASTANRGKPISWHRRATAGIAGSADLPMRTSVSANSS